MWFDEFEAQSRSCITLARLSALVPVPCALEPSCVLLVDETYLCRLRRIHSELSASQGTCYEGDILGRFMHTLVLDLFSGLRSNGGGMGRALSFGGCVFDVTDVATLGELLWYQVDEVMPLTFSETWRILRPFSTWMRKSLA